ncbi:hypothetical protein [Nonomuraea sp. NPDC003214]
MTADRARLTEDVDPDLLQALVDLGATYGPLGVALAAAKLSDPAVVARRLLRSEPASAAGEREPGAAGKAGVVINVEPALPAGHAGVMVTDGRGQAWPR